MHVFSSLQLFITMRKVSKLFSASKCFLSAVLKVLREVLSFTLMLYPLRGGMQSNCPDHESL
jgi:hypothetical protein